MRRFLLYIFLVTSGFSALAAEADSSRVKQVMTTTTAFVEGSVTASSGTFTPLWLTSNRYGLGSVEPYSNYERAAASRAIGHDDGRRWGLGYALDLAVAFGHTRTFVVNEAFVEGRFHKVGVTLGSKRQPLETKDVELTSGGLSLGANALPIPQARLDINWFAIPGTKEWWQWKLYGSFGMMTDGRWQEDWNDGSWRYARHMLYHEKALYWRVGKTEVLPFTYEIGLQMATQFGGTTYNGVGRGIDAHTTIHHATGLKAFWNALLCRGSDQSDGLQPNTAGNTLGSYVMSLQYHGNGWKARAYWERYFDDQSMLTVQYGIRDMLIGADASLPRNKYLSKAALEFVTTKNQSGAVYHDRSVNIPDKMNGRDNYYNHILYAGWQNYGLTLGNPLLTSPLYNEAFGHQGMLKFYNNRIRAWHIALTGDPSSEWHWRLKATFTRNWGSYEYPLSDCLSQTYTMAEATYTPRWARGWHATAAVALDHGTLLGNSIGAQLTVRQSF